MSFHSVRSVRLSVLLAALGASPALAHEPQLPPQPLPAASHAVPPGWDQARAAWLDECRSRAHRGNRAAGAVVGGVLGGVLGNRLGGPDDRVLGTVAGVAVGAAAEVAVDAAVDRQSARDWCEAYLDRHLTWGIGAGGALPLAGYAVLVPLAAVPVQSAAVAPCRETVVTEEWVPAPVRRSRQIAPRRAPSPGKRWRGS